MAKKSELQKAIEALEKKRDALDAAIAELKEQQTARVRVVQNVDREEVAHGI
jgi:exonuclease VII small subunit